MTLFDLSGQVAFVTGAGRGIGAGVARQLYEMGASVVLADVDHQAVVSGAAELGERAIGLRLDVTDPDEWEAALAATVDAFGPPTALVNNAGIGVPAELDVETVEGFSRTLDVNVVGAFLGIKFCAPHLRTAGKGSIVNISSVNGFVGTPGMSAYSASKFAVRGLTKSAAAELAGAGIRVNAVCPGFIETPMSVIAIEETLGIEGDVDMDEVYGPMVPAGRVGQPRDIAGAVAWLVSDASLYVNGSDIIVDGGLFSTIIG